VPTKILVADDSVTMRRVLEMTFAGEDARVVTVDSAEAALNKVAELSPDVVLADVSMPGVDGYELCRKLKSNAASAKTAVIVLASQHHPYDDAKGRAAGVDDHVSKPFDTQAMIERVHQVLARPRVSPAGAPAEAPKAAAAPKPPAPPPAPAAPPQAPRVPPPPAPQVAAAASPGLPAAPKVQLPPPPAATPEPVKPVAAPALEIARPASPVAAAPAAVRGLGALETKLSGLGLSAEQLAGVLALSREVIEQVVWEVVPDLAETLIKEEIRRLTAE
jgi:CheY-like chemotaxis protein